MSFGLFPQNYFFEQRFCVAIWKPSLSGASILRVIRKRSMREERESNAS